MNHQTENRYLLYLSFKSMNLLRKPRKNPNSEFFFYGGKVSNLLFQRFLRSTILVSDLTNYFRKFRGIKSNSKIPSVTVYNQNGIKLCEEFWLNNELHNSFGYALIEYYENGNKKKEYCYKNGKLHKEDGPAVISYHQNGRIRVISYYFDSQRHRDCGKIILGNLAYVENEQLPAVITYDEFGNEIDRRFWIRDRNVKTQHQIINCDEIWIPSNSFYGSHLDID